MSGGPAPIVLRDLTVLKRVKIENFRSLEKVAINLDPLTALVGPNGTGKSSVLQALDLVLGQRWPSVNRLNLPNDLTGCDPKRPLLVQVRLDEPIEHVDAASASHNIHGFGISCKPYKIKTKKALPGDPNFDFLPLDDDGEQPIVAVRKHKGTPQFGPLMTVSGELRDQAAVLFIDHRRSLRDHAPWARQSILTKLLTPARKELDKVEFSEGRTHADEFRARYQEAMEALRTPKVQEIEQTISDTTKRALGFYGHGAEVDVRFGFADPDNPLGTLNLRYREDGLDLPAEQLGSGVQSAIVVGMFEALRITGTTIGTVMIEEPEMYLHPQAQRYLYSMLCDLVDNDQAQVIYSTHSPVFADLRRFEALRVLRREPGHATKVSSIEKTNDVAYLNERRGKQKLHQFTAARSELLFARRVLLVEGPGDAIAARLCAEEDSIDLDAEDFSVIECGAKSAIPFFVKVCKSLGIPYAVLHDGDIRSADGLDSDQAAKVEAQNAVEQRTNADIQDVADSDRVFIADPSLEGVLGVSRHASDKPMRVMAALEALAPAAWPPALRDAVAALKSPVSS